MKNIKKVESLKEMINFLRKFMDLSRHQQFEIIIKLKKEMLKCLK